MYVERECRNEAENAVFFVVFASDPRRKHSGLDENPASLAITVSRLGMYFQV